MKDDFGIFTGSYADLNSDGEVDLAEYLIDEMEYNDIMGKDSFDDDCLYDDHDYGFDDCFDNDSFLDDDIDENDYDTICSDSNFDANVSENTTAEKEISNIERRYYDFNEELYRIGDAIYDNFKAVRDNFERYECKEFSVLLETIYKVDKSLSVEIWTWAIHNFQGALVNRGVSDWNSQAGRLTDRIFSSFIETDRESDDEYESTFICRYVSKNPDLEEIIYNKSYIDNEIFSQYRYIPYCVENNLRENFLRVYNGIMSNSSRNEEKMSKYSFLNSLMVFCSIWGIKDADPWFYAFFEKEIHSLNKPIKEAYLMKILNEEEYGRKIFKKPKKKNLDLNDEYFGKGNTPETEYKKLKRENEELKLKVKQLENSKTDLIGNIRELETKHAVKGKEFEEKYYRYCKVKTDEFSKGLWYRTDDISLKTGDYVYVPFGEKNEKQMAKVVFVDEFHFDDIPFPLEKTKFIFEKCNT